MLRSFGIQTFLKNQKFSNLASYALIGIMSACVLFILVAVGEQLQPGWQGGYVRWFGMIVILEAFIAKIVIDSFDENKTWIFRLSELGIIIFGLKMVQLSVVGFQRITEVLTSWQADLINFFDGEYLVVLLLIFLIWLHVTRYIDLMATLNSYESDLFIYEFVQLRTEREIARISMVNQFLMVGIILIILITMVRTDLQNMALFSGQALALPLAVRIFPLAVYFLSGLVLLSLSRFAILRGAWLVGKQKIQPDIAIQWLKYAVLLFGLVSFLALLLPTAYTKDFLKNSAAVFQLIAEVAMFLIGLLVFPFVWLFSLILSLLPTTENAGTDVGIPQLNLPESVVEQAAKPDWFALIQNAAFWLILLAIVIITVRYYILQNKSYFKQLSFSSIKSWGKGLWLGFWTWVRMVRKQIVDILPSGSKKTAADPEKKKNIFDWINQQIGEKSPREQIIQNYQAFLQQSEKMGVHKKPGQTPAQYRAMLDQLLSEEAKNETQEVTQTFIKARYSLSKIEAQDVTRLDPIWKRLLEKIKQTLLNR